MGTGIDLFLDWEHGIIELLGIGYWEWEIKWVLMGMGLNECESTNFFQVLKYNSIGFGPLLMFHHMIGAYKPSLVSCIADPRTTTQLSCMQTFHLQPLGKCDWTKF